MTLWVLATNDFLLSKLWKVFSHEDVLLSKLWKALPTVERGEDDATQKYP